MSSPSLLSTFPNYLPRGLRKVMASTAAKAVSPFSVSHRFYVKSLYKRYLKNELDWTVHRHLWRYKAIQIRAEFERNRNVSDPRALATILEKAEADLAAKQHPDPYITPTAPGGTLWERHTPPTLGPIYDHEADPHHH